MITAPTVSEIESRFAHLKREEQLVVLERLVHQMRVVDGEGNGHFSESVITGTAGAQLRREWERLNANLKASEADLLSELE